MTSDERIAAERKALKLAPWQFAPSQAVGPNPYPVGTAGHTSWAEAQAWAAELAEKPRR